MNANPTGPTRGQVILNVVCFAIIAIPAWLIWKWLVWAAHTGPYGPAFYDVDFEQAPQSIETVSDLIDCGTGLVWYFTGSEMIPVMNEDGVQKHLVCEDPDREPAYRGYSDKAHSQDQRTQAQRRYLEPWP